MDGFGHTFTSNSSMYAYQADDECPGSTDLNSIRLGQEFKSLN